MIVIQSELGESIAQRVVNFDVLNSYGPLVLSVPAIRVKISINLSVIFGESYCRKNENNDVRKKQLPNRLSNF